MLQSLKGEHFGSGFKGCGWNPSFNLPLHEAHTPHYGEMWHRAPRPGATPAITDDLLGMLHISQPCCCKQGSGQGQGRRGGENVVEQDLNAALIKDLGSELGDCSSSHSSDALSLCSPQQRDGHAANTEH